MVIEQVWRDLGLAQVLTEIERERCRTLDLERIVFAMVLNRLVDPTSKRDCVEWVKFHAWMPEGKDWNVDHFYAAMDVIERHRVEILRHVARAVLAQATPEDRRILLLDTTTTFTEAILDDDTIAELAREWLNYERGVTTVWTHARRSHRRVSRGHDHHAPPPPARLRSPRPP